MSKSNYIVDVAQRPPSNIGMRFFLALCAVGGKSENTFPSKVCHPQHDHISLIRPVSRSFSDVRKAGVLSFDNSALAHRLVYPTVVLSNSVDLEKSF